MGKKPTKERCPHAYSVDVDELNLLESEKRRNEMHYGLYPVSSVLYVLEKLHGHP